MDLIIFDDTNDKIVCPIEFLNQQCPSGTLHYPMKPKVGDLIMLLRILDPMKVRGYYKRNRHFQRYVVSKLLAYWTHNLRSSVEERWKFFPRHSLMMSAPRQRP